MNGHATRITWFEKGEMNLKEKVEELLFPEYMVEFEATKKQQMSAIC